MSFFECVPSPKIADAQHEDDLPETRIPLPMVEGDFLNGTDKFASAIAANPNVIGLERIETGPDVTTMPIDQVSTQFSKSSKEKFRVSREGILLATTLGLAFGIAIGGVWSSPHLTENLKATNLHGVVEAIFAGSSNAEQPTQQPLPASTDTKLSEIADQLVALTSDLSSMKRNIKELATGQEQIRKAQEQLVQTQLAGQEHIRKTHEQLAQMQSRFSALQAQANLKQHPQPSPHPSDGRRLDRRGGYYYPLR